MAEPRAFTAEEVRDQIIARAWEIARFWAEDERYATPSERTAGAVFSLLVLLDGEDAEMPGFALTPQPHPDDEAYHRRLGENWWSDDTVVDDGSLHARFYRQEPRKPVVT